MASCNNGAKRKRVTLSLQQKMEIAKKMQEGVSRQILMREYNVGSSMLYDIKKQESKLKDFCLKTESEQALKQRCNLRGPQAETLDAVLYEWFCLKRTEGACISGPMLQEKARELHIHMKIEKENTYSQGWLTKFKGRHGIRKLDISGEQESANDDAAEKFKDYLKKIIDDEELTGHQIYNADETGLFYKCLPTSTLACRKEKVAHGFKKNKERMTVLCCANAAGSHRVKLLVVGKSKKPRCFSGINVDNLPVHYRNTKSAWMSAEIFKKWFFQTFVPAVKKNLKKQGLSENSKVILLLDNCRAHPPADELHCGNIYVMYLPPNVTSLIQPMDQGVIQNLKTNYRRYFMRRLVNYDGHIPDFQKNYNIKDAIYNVAAAWDTVKSETLRRCWRKIWHKVIFELGSEDEEDFEGFPTSNQKRPASAMDDIVDLVHPNRNGKIAMTREEVEEWVNVDKDLPVTCTLDTDEIIDSVMKRTQDDDDDDESSEDELPETEKVSWKEAVDAFEKIMTFADQHNSAFDTHTVVQLHIIQGMLLQQRQRVMKQSNILDMLKRMQSKVEVVPAAADAILADEETSDVDDPKPSTSGFVFPQEDDL